MSLNRLRRWIPCALALAPCSLAGAADAPYADMEPQARQACLKAPDYPLRDQPPATQPACDSIAAYYGIGEPVDDVKARACAYVGKDYDVLTMIYANGRGVPRDIGVARKAACDADGAPAEIEGRLRHLARIEAQGPVAGHPFEFCDDITSGLMMGYCENIAARRADQQRADDLARRSATWPADQRTAFAALRVALDAFVAAHDGEVDLGGTARAAMVIAEEEAQRKAFVALLERAEAGKMGEASAARAQATDAQLNATWRQLKATSDAKARTTVKLADIQSTQRAWLRYRDAWVAFGHVRYPNVAASTWLAALTTQREKQLAELLADRR